MQRPAGTVIFVIEFGCGMMDENARTQTDHVFHRYIVVGRRVNAALKDRSLARRERYCPALWV